MCNTVTDVTETKLQTLKRNNGRDILEKHKN